MSGKGNGKRREARLPCTKQIFEFFEALARKLLLYKAINKNEV
ncbi:hypothetical protein SD77_0729 [Bacillus badius]|uniref:Ribose 5-phosphate isomerase B n=1 Tax=Bacillus badius TaxID=1455 RepID=A0ABR5ATP8_BACBA|nr:hypothetical protein SD78_4025 [Bacillus badius]KIL78128.1 hypothetical protein SD77_0729 [Bacillus badius]